MKNPLIIFLYLISSGLQAQVFPVQVNPQLVPPYSPYLSDYASPGAQHLTVYVTLNDITLSAYPCRLRISIEGVGITLRTKQDFRTQPTILEGSGAPQLLYGDDLREYFHPDALDFSGITRSDYEKNGRLPEGVYRFSVEVLDYNRGTVVSNKGVAVAWIMLNDPPLLNRPANFSKVDLQDPANIFFSWTPRHTGSPNAAFTTEYIFRLVEVWPADRNPHDAFLTQPPLYETTTTENQIVYGMSEPALLPGRKYAWRVEARDAGGKDLFKNKGRSEVFLFQFGDALAAPRNLHMRWAKPTTLAISWDPVKGGNPEEIKYRLTYRPRRRVPDHQWYETRTKFTDKTLYHLQPDTEYEMKVRAETPLQESEYTETRVFRTQPEETVAFVCRDVPPPPLPDNSLPVFPLMVNDTIHAGGYKVLVRDVMQMEGKYSGSGMAIIPWFNAAKVRVTFENIRVNKHFRLTSGLIKSVWNPESTFLIEEANPVTPGDAPKAGALDITVMSVDSLIVIDGHVQGTVIVAVTKNEAGDIVVMTSDGGEQTLDKGVSYAVVDDVGNGYVIDGQGNIAKTTSDEARAVAARGDRRYDLAFRFAKGHGRFGFDEKKFEALSPYYQQLEEGVFASWKALSSSQPDVIEGYLTSREVDLRAVRFEAGTTPVTPASAGGDKITFSLQGKVPGLEEELVALHQPADTVPEKVLGKINLVTYDPIRYNLVIVPVNDASIPGGLSAYVISSSLNNVFNQAVVEWSVAISGRIEVPLEATFDEGEAGLLSNYTDDMKKVLKVWGRMEEQTYYLFLIDEPRNMATLGYMPRNSRAGFVFIAPHEGNSDEFLKTLAHELGHGAFNLKHTFSEHPLPSGTTDNLMDYSEGTALYKYQWDHIHNPQGVLGLFEGGEEGAMGGLTDEQDLHWWHDQPYHKKAARILRQHLDDTGIYENVELKCDDSKCQILADLKIGQDITYTMEISLPSSMSADELIEVLMFEYRVDLWQAFNVKADDIWDELYHWWRKQNDDLAQQKGWQVSTLNFLADVITAPTMVPAVEGWITGKHWRDGHKLAGWEQALAVLDFLVAEEIAKGCITNFVVRVGNRSLSLLKIPQPVRTLLSNAIGSGYKIVAISETEFILKSIDEFELAKIFENSFYLLHNGKQIPIDLTKRTTLLGRFFGGTQNFLSVKFQMSSIFNMLDVLGWAKPTAPSAATTVSEASKNALEFWKSFNKHFIDDAIANGDDLVFLTDPEDLRNLFHSDANRRILDLQGNTIEISLTGNITDDVAILVSRNAFPTMFGREVIYLSEKLGVAITDLASKFYK